MAAGEEKLRLVLAAVDKTSAPIRKVNRQISEMLKPVRKVRNAFRSLARESGLSKLGAAVGKVGQRLKQFGFIGVGALGAISAVVSKVASQGDEIAKLSRQIGIGAEAFQEFEFAADRSGVASSVFRSSVEALSKRVGELKRGKGALSTILGDSDLSRQLKAAKDTGVALELISNEIARIEDPTKKAALAAAAYSRAGLPMIRMANEGADGLKALREEARRLGRVFSQDAVEQSEEVEDAFTNMRAAARGVVGTLAVQLFPTFKQIAESVTAWTLANREMLRVKVGEFLREMVTTGRDVALWIRDTIPKVKNFVESIGGLKTVAVALAGIFALTLLPAIAAVVVSITAIAGAIGAPVGVIVLAIGLIGAAAVKVSHRWDSIKASVSGSIDFISKKLTSMLSLIPEPVKQALGFVGGAALRSVSPIAAPIASAAAAQFAPAPASSASQVGGKIEIQVDDKRVSVKSTRETNPNVPFEFSGGQALAAQ